MAVALLAIACGHVGDRGATRGDAGGQGTRIDSSGARTVVEGVAAPSATLAPRPSAADSADRLDRAYQAERASINAEAFALDTLPIATRRSTAYARRFDALRRATLHADTLRAKRDRERAKARREGPR